MILGLGSVAACENSRRWVSRVFIGGSAGHVREKPTRNPHNMVSFSFFFFFDTEHGILL